MGYYASTTGADDVAPVEDFSPPPDLNAPRGTIAGTSPTARARRWPSAKVALGSVVAEADADGRYTLDVPARTYANLVFSAPGHDRAIGAGDRHRRRRRRRSTRRCGATGPRSRAARPSSGGDEYAADGCGSLAAIDQHPGTAWSTPGPGPKAMTIVLPQTIDVDHFEVDPGEGCGDDSGRRGEGRPDRDLAATARPGRSRRRGRSPAATGTA